MMISFPDNVLGRQLGIAYPTDIAPTYLLISQAQYKVFLIMHFVAPLSIFGSLAIVYRILKIDRYDPDAGGRRTYHRLLVGMSICDVFGSVALGLGTTPIPKETLLVGARGNTATCTAQAFIIHWFARAVLYYNAGLMIYFVLTIRYSWTESRASKLAEPVIHAWALTIPLVQAVVCLLLDSFHPIGFGNFCHIAPFPPICDIFDACTRGWHTKLLYTLFCTIPESILLGVIYVSIVLIYCTVRHQARRALIISGNQNMVRAKIKTVAVQSWLFAFIFFITWVFTVLGPLFGVALQQAEQIIRAEYILSVLASTFLPLQGFFNFCIYIRPRFVRLREERGLSVRSALVLAVFGGRETLPSRRRSSLLHQRKRSSNTAPPQNESALIPAPHDGMAIDAQTKCSRDEASMLQSLPESGTEGNNESAEEGNENVVNKDQGQVPCMPSTTT